MDLTIHRGADEIGGSCVELRSRSGNTRLIIDIGMPLVDSDGAPFEWARYSALAPSGLVERGVLPPVEGLYSWQQPEVSAVVLSHSHQDHYGFLRFVHPDIPIYLSRGTRALIEVSNLFLNTNVSLHSARTIEAWTPFSIGEFTFTPYLMDHSAPDAEALLVQCDGTRLFYTEDFRGHGRKAILFERLLRHPPPSVDCLLMEGTMLGRGEGLFKDENAIETALYERFKNQGSSTIVMCSSQNLDRIVSVYRAALRAGKTLVIDLYTAFVLDKLGVLSTHVPQFSWRNIRVVFPGNQAHKLAGEDVTLLYKYNASKIRADELIDAAESYVVLARDNKYFRTQLFPRLCKGAMPTVVYSMWSGYLERGDLRTFLSDRRVELVEVHTGGHAVLDDLARLASAINPRVLIPIHTFRARDYATHFSNVVLLKDGRTLQLGSLGDKGGRDMTSEPAIERYFSGDSDRLQWVYKHLRHTVGLINSSGGEYSLQIREDYFNIYYRGNSVAKVELPRTGDTYVVSIHKRFLVENWWESHATGASLEPGLKDLERFPNRRSADSKYQAFAVEGDELYWFFQKSHLERLGRNIRRVNAGEETALEQLVMTDNPPQQDFIIIDRQVGDHVSRAQMDLLALTRRGTDAPFHFLIMELKLGRNKELEGPVASQLEDYIARIRSNYGDYVRCYKLNYQQKWDMGLIDPRQYPDAPTPAQVTIDPNSESVEGIIVVGGYSQIGLKAIAKLRREYPNVRVLQLTRKIDPHQAC